MRNSMIVSVMILSLSLTAGRFDAEEIESLTPKIIAGCEAHCKEGACLKACAAFKKAVEEKATGKQLCEAMHPALHNAVHWNAMSYTPEQKRAYDPNMRELLLNYTKVWRAHCLTTCKHALKAWNFSDKTMLWGTKTADIGTLIFDASSPDDTFLFVMRKMRGAQSICEELQNEAAKLVQLTKKRDAAAAELDTARQKIAAMWRENAGRVREALGCKTCSAERLPIIYAAAQEICKWEPRRKAMAEEVKIREQQRKRHGVEGEREILIWLGELEDAEIHIEEAKSTVMKQEIAGLNCSRFAQLNIDDGSKKLVYYEQPFLKATSALQYCSDRIAQLMEK